MFTFIFHQILHSANNKIAPSASKRVKNRQQMLAIYSREFQDAELCVNIGSQLVRSETLKTTPCLSTDNYCYSVRMLLSIVLWGVVRVRDARSSALARRQ